MTTPARAKLPLPLLLLVVFGAVSMLGVVAVAAWALVTQRPSPTSMTLVVAADASEAVSRLALHKADGGTDEALRAGLFDKWRRDTRDAVLTTLRARVADLDGSVVVGTPERYGQPADALIFVVTVEPDDNSADTIARRLTRSARLEFALVVENAPTLEGVPLPAGVERARNPFQARDGTEVIDEHLVFSSAMLGELRKLVVDPRVRFGPAGPTAANRGDGAANTWRSYVVGAPVLANADIARASVALGDPAVAQPYVVLEFTAAGKERFAQVTTEHVGRRLAIVLEDEVTMAPVINEPITGGSAQITLGSAGSRADLLRDAVELERTLNAGALPLPLSVVSVSR